MWFACAFYLYTFLVNCLLDLLHFNFFIINRLFIQSIFDIFVHFCQKCFWTFDFLIWKQENFNLPKQAKNILMVDFTWIYLDEHINF